MRLTDPFIGQRKAQGPPRTWNESQEDEEEEHVALHLPWNNLLGQIVTPSGLHCYVS